MKRRRRARRNRSAGYLIAVATILGLAAIGTFVLGRDYTQLSASPPSFLDAQPPSFDPVEDVTLGIAPDSTYQATATPTAAIRAIEVLPRQTVMLSGGRAIRVIDVRAPRTLSALVRIVRNRRWIRQSSGTVTLDAAVIVERGASLTVAAPVTSRLVMTVRPGVFLAAYQEGRLRIAGVDVQASDAGVPAPGSPPSATAGRPFLLAAVNSTMTIKYSTFEYLGRDWNSSYGVAWTKSSSGSVSDSYFDHDFTGVYTNNSSGVQVMHDRFLHSSLYGIESSSGSSGLLIEYDTVAFSGRHGIILSNDVTGSAISYDTTEGNGLNGIQMDESSTDNVISHNVVSGNGFGGVVLSGSGGNLVTDNSVSGNQVGIAVRGTTAGTRILGNTVATNKLASQGASLAQNTVYGNGDQWLPRRIGLIWLSAFALLGFLLGLTRAMQPRRRHIKIATAVAR